MPPMESTFYRMILWQCSNTPSSMFKSYKDQKRKILQARVRCDKYVQSHIVCLVTAIRFYSPSSSSSSSMLVSRAASNIWNTAQCHFFLWIGRRSNTLTKNVTFMWSLDRMQCDAFSWQLKSSWCFQSIFSSTFTWIRFFFL